MAQHTTYNLAGNGRTIILDNRQPRGVQPGSAPGFPFTIVVTGASDLGGGTATLQISYANANAGDERPSATTDALWLDMADSSAAALTLTVGAGEAYQHPAPWIAINLTGATNPDLTFIVSV